MMKKSRILIYSFTFLILIMIIIISQTGLKYEPEKRIEKIIFDNNKIILSSDLLKYCNLINSKENRELSAEAVLDRIERYPYVSSATGEFIDSATFLIHLTEEIPEFLVETNNGLYILTQNNKLLKYDPNVIVFDIPVISGITLNQYQKFDYEAMKKLTMAKRINDEIERTNNILTKLISEIDFEEGEINLFFSEPKARIVTGYDFNSDIAKKLNTFWTRVLQPDTDTKYAFIDLRFDGQIVTKENVAGLE